MKEYLITVSLAGLVLFVFYLVLFLIMNFFTKMKDKKLKENEKRLIEDCIRILKEENKYGVGYRQDYSKFDKDCKTKYDI